MDLYIEADLYLSTLALISDVWTLDQDDDPASALAFVISLLTE